MKKLYRQYNLEYCPTPDRHLVQHITAWLQDGLKVGARVTLKDSENPQKWWTVAGMGDTLLPKDELHKKSQWNNNI